jgi:GTPase SAR1 family protein
MNFTDNVQINDLLKILTDNGYNLVSKNDENFDWRTLLKKSSRGKVYATYENHKIVFENAIKGELKYNEFERIIEYNGKAIDNTTNAMLRNEFERYGDFRNKDVMRDFIIQYSYEHRYNPIKDYIENLQWDGKQRVSTMFIDWFNVEDNIVNRKLAEKWLVSGIKRIYEPGCLIEGMVVLVGAQGVGKSTFIKRLGKSKYSIEAIVDLRNEKNCVETFNRAWIVNFDELKSLIKADSDLAKAVLTRQCDTSRLAYREESETYDRHCIFIGATNDTSILKDYTDKVERRYWMMQCNQTDKRYIYANFTDEVVNQLWAEAYHIYKNNSEYNISISDFTDDELEIMYNTQRNFKTFKGDDLSNDLIEMLNANYSLNECGEFKSKEDFLNQALGKTNYDTHNLFNRIDAIPFSYINHYLQYVKKSRPNQYIIEVLADEWRDVARYNYNGQRVHCLVRKE